MFLVFIIKLEFFGWDLRRGSRLVIFLVHIVMYPKHLQGAFLKELIETIIKFVFWSRSSEILPKPVQIKYKHTNCSSILTFAWFLIWNLCSDSFFLLALFIML